MYFSSKWDPSLIKNGRRFLVDAIFLLSGYFSLKRKGHVHSNSDNISFLISPCIRYRFLTTQFLAIKLYCAFHKHGNSKVQKPPSQLHFSLPSIIIMITSNEPWNTQTHKMDRNPPITNHKPWPFEPVIVKFCFLRGLLRWLTAAKKT